MKPLVLPSHAGDRDTDGTGMEEPRRDYSLLADALGAEILPPRGTDGSLLGRIEARTATDIRQAFAAARLRRTTSVYVSLSERIGIPLAFLLPRNRPDRPAHLLIAHHLTSPRKRVLQGQTNYLRRFDRVITLASSQAGYLVAEAGYDEARSSRISDAVDARFWGADHDSSTRDLPAPEADEPGYLIAVGRERRDYAAFVAALRGTPEMLAVVVASSPWSRDRERALTISELPANTAVVTRTPSAALRTLYRNASLVVVPLLPETDYAAGVNVCLEAMAAGTPVLATATPGLADYARSDTTGEEVMATISGGDPTALREAIIALLADPARRERLARAGSDFVAREASLERYVARVAELVRAVALPG